MQNKDTLKEEWREKWNNDEFHSQYSNNIEPTLIEDFWLDKIEQTRKERDMEIFKYLDERKHHGFVKMKYVKEALNIINDIKN